MSVWVTRLVWGLRFRAAAVSHLLPAIWSELDAVVGYSLVDITVFYLRPGQLGANFGLM